MLRKFSWRIGALLVSAAALVALVGASIAPAASHKASAGTMRIWTDGDRKAAITKVANAWALEERRQRPGRAEGVRRHPQPARRPSRPRTLRTSSSAAHDWTGELAANGLVVPLVPKAAALKAIPAYARKAFTYGKLYGMPVALENVGLFVNTAVAKVPKSWSDLEKKALAFQKKGGGRVGLAVQQGSGGDAYHMYPFFSGLCGYVFGTSNGRLNAEQGRRRQQGVPQELAADQQVEQGRPDQLQDQRRHRDPALHERQGRVLGHRPLEHRYRPQGRHQLQDRPGPEDQVQGSAVPRRPGPHGHQVRLGPRRRHRVEGLRRQLHGRRGPAGSRSQRPTTATRPTRPPASASPIRR